MIVKRRIKFGAREGRYISKHTITQSFGVMFPKVYSRLVRAPYTGAELRELRQLRGVGPVRRIAL
jgi:hypothetical protein